jgi:hypothetical protein
MKRLFLLAMFGLVLGTDARADIAPPLPAAKEAVAVKIEVDEKANGPRLVVPNGVFTAPRVRPVPKKSSDPKSELPSASDDAVADENGSNSTRYLVAGAALTIALTCGGFYLLRRNGRGSTSGMALLIAAGATILVGAVVTANAPPPIRPAKPKTESYPAAYEGKAQVEFVYGQEPVRLILDKESYEKLKAGKLTPAE